MDSVVVTQVNRWNDSVAAKIKVISDNFLRYRRYFEDGCQDAGSSQNFVTVIKAKSDIFNDGPNKSVVLNNTEETTDILKSEFLKASEALSNWNFFLPLVNELNVIDNEKLERQNSIRADSLMNCSMITSVIKRNKQLKRKKSRRVSDFFVLCKFTKISSKKACLLFQKKYKILKPKNKQVYEKSLKEYSTYLQFFS